MNVSIISKANVKNMVLDELAKELPVIISGLLEVPGGKLAILKPEQISLEFSHASTRDVGSDIRISVFARSIRPRTITQNNLVKTILEKVVTLIAKTGEELSVSIRLYLTEIGAAEYSPAN
jgi:phosphate starvation-inducible protein PhoH